MSTVGFLGLGSMGSAMAGRLVDAGHEVRVWNRSPEAVEAAVANGAVAAESPEDALSCEVSFSMLANDEAMSAVMTPPAVSSPSVSGVTSSSKISFTSPWSTPA